MNTTYQRVWANADMEWKFYKSFYQVEFLAPRAVLPGPFRPIYYLAKGMYHWKGRNQDKKMTRKDKRRDREENYKETLTKILNTKIQSDRIKLLERNPREE